MHKCDSTVATSYSVAFVAGFQVRCELLPWWSRGYRQRRTFRDRDLPLLDIPCLCTRPIAPRVNTTARKENRLTQDRQFVHDSDQYSKWRHPRY
jgi:hypothetical protein